MSQVTIDQAIQIAVQQHQAGRLAEAEAIYRQVLAQQPDCAPVLHLLGVVASQTGRLEAAEELIERAIQLNPGDPMPHSNLAKLLLDMGRPEGAIAAARRAIELNPRFFQAYNHLGNAWIARGERQEAIAAYRRAIALHPAFADAHNNLGNALKDEGLVQEAMACYRHAMELEPNYVEPLSNLGNLLREQGFLQESAAVCREAIRVGPGYAPAHNNLSCALRELGLLDESVAASRETIRLNPRLAESHNNLGNTLQLMGRLEEAIASYRAAIGLNPEYAEAYNNLGAALCAGGAFDAAAEALHHALRCRPRYAEAHNNLGMLQKDCGQVPQAIESFRQALACKPDFMAAHSNLIFMLDFFEETDIAMVRAELRRWNARFAAPLKKVIQPHANDRAPERPLRIGYVSPNFRDHCQAFYTLPLFSHHDRAKFHITGYCDVVRPDAFTQRLRKECGEWRNIAGMADERVAELIRADGIDILVDLTMHMAHHRLLVFARKPAPVQVSWLAYPGTTGLEAIDYHLVDPYLDPLEEEPVFPERPEESVRLPESFWCYDPLAVELAVNPPPVLGSGIITFGSLNSFAKINATVLALWARVLLAVPGSQLIMLSPEGAHRRSTLEVLVNAGVAAERVTFTAHLPRAAYLAKYQEIDIALDPVPSNGHTTSLDALWMGVPVVTLVGKTFVGRAGLCQLMNLGLPELIARTPEEYVRIAAELAKDVPRLAALRSGLRERMRASPLMDAPRFARNVEAAYRAMWRKWCAS